MESTLLQIHKVSVLLFLLIYLVKTVLLLANRISKLDRFSRIVKVPEMIISTLFLVTGIWLFVLIGSIKTIQVIKLVAVFASIPLAVVGFKKKNKGLAAFSLFLIIMSYGLAEMSKKIPYPVVRKTDGLSSQEVSKSLYTDNCARCHGENGDAMIMNASNLRGSVLSKEEMASVIRDGRKAMPAYKMLSDEEINGLAEYLQTFRN